MSYTKYKVIVILITVYCCMPHFLICEKYTSFFNFNLHSQFVSMSVAIIIRKPIKSNISCLLPKVFFVSVPLEDCMTHFFFIYPAVWLWKHKLHKVNTVLLCSHKQAQQTSQLIIKNVYRENKTTGRKLNSATCPNCQVGD